MTADMMSECGISVDLDRESVKIAPGAYSKVFSGVEPDWSAASYWYEIAALTAGWVTLEGLKDLSMQGDRGHRTPVRTPRCYYRVWATKVLSFRQPPTFTTASMSILPTCPMPFRPWRLLLQCWYTPLLAFGRRRSTSQGK